MSFRLAALVAAIAFSAFALGLGTASAAARSDVLCGEKAQISVTITDSAGQPVSDHTLVEFVTNQGGVIAGTDTALAGGQVGGEIGPISSATAETFNGVA